MKNSFSGNSDLFAVAALILIIGLAAPGVARLPFHRLSQDNFAHLEMIGARAAMHAERSADRFGRCVQHIEKHAQRMEEHVDRVERAIEELPFQ